MRINELIQEFTIQTSNEEKDMLSKLQSIKNLDTFMERDQEVINVANKAKIKMLFTGIRHFNH